MQSRAKAYSEILIVLLFLCLCVTFLNRHVSLDYWISATVVMHAILFWVNVDFFFVVVVVGGSYPVHAIW